MASDNHFGIDLATFSLEDIAERVSEYLGDYDAEQVDVAAIAKICMAFFELKDSRNREAAVKVLGAFFCRSCGGGYLPCYCMRDD